MGRDHWAHRFPWAWWYEKLPKNGRPCSQLRGEGLVCHWPMSLFWGSHIFPLSPRVLCHPPLGFLAWKEGQGGCTSDRIGCYSKADSAASARMKDLPLDIAASGTEGTHHLCFWDVGLNSGLKSRVLFRVTPHSRVAGGQGRGGFRANCPPPRGTLWVSCPRPWSHKAGGRGRGSTHLTAQFQNSIKTTVVLIKNCKIYSCILENL